MRKEIVLIVLALVLAGCVSPPAPEPGSGVKDCGHDLDCFRESASIGEKAVFSVEMDGGAFTQTIEECLGENCSVFVKITKSPESVPPELAPIILASGEMTCQVQASQVGEIPEDIEKCSGPLVEIIKAFQEQNTPK